MTAGLRESTRESHGGFLDTVAIVVAYRPELAQLQGSISQLRKQCDVLIVDNSDQPDVASALSELSRRTDAYYVSMAGNKGIAAAQNAGIAWMIEKGKTYVLLLDDDSSCGSSLVENLRAADAALRASGKPVAAVGARARTSTGLDVSNARVNNSGVTPVGELMSSGALIRSDVLQYVGGMEEKLFIDCVDYEWGWRAQARGLRLFLLDSEYIDHRMGCGQVSICGCRVGVPIPIRHYYQYRNILWMLVRRYVPLRWKLKQLIALMAKPVVFVLFVSPRSARVTYMLQGIRDALLGKGGAYDG